jgi:regulation of enolase protein 1 (concanavalin A-like superfamily)
MYNDVHRTTKSFYNTNAKLSTKYHLYAKAYLIITDFIKCPILIHDIVNSSSKVKTNPILMISLIQIKAKSHKRNEM